MNVKYDHTHLERLNAERAELLEQMKGVVAAATAADRDMNDAELAACEKAQARIEELAPEIKAQKRAAVNAVIALGGDEDDGYEPYGRKTGFVNLTAPEVKSGMSRRAGALLRQKALSDLDSGDVTSLPLVDTIPMSRPAQNLFEVIPATVSANPVFKYLVQTGRSLAASTVASGGTKPTSDLTFTPETGEVKVIATVSNPLDKFVLEDAGNLEALVANELSYGVRLALEEQIVYGNGTTGGGGVPNSTGGPNFTGLLESAGQTQDDQSDPFLATRAAITKLEVLGLAPAAFVMSPADWEAIETETLTAGQYVLNAEGAGGGLPINAATRRLWGVPVVASTAVTDGDKFLLAQDSCRLYTTGGLRVEWSENVSDDFTKNRRRLRVESRFEFIVTRPDGVVLIDTDQS